MAGDSVSFDDASARLLRETLGTAHPHLQRFVCPIFGANERGIPELIGSGVLIQVSSKFFLLTAAHVLDRGAHTTLYVAGRNGLVTLHGQGFRAMPPSKGRDYDKLDVGFVLLFDATVAELQHGHSFLCAQDLDVSGLPQDVYTYAFVGYPETRNRPRPNHKIRLGGMMVSVSPCPMETHRREELSPSIHLIGNFDQSRMANNQNKIVVAPQPYGMSGGGIWCWRSRNDLLLPVHHGRFVGIAIAWRKIPKLLIGVRVSLFLAAMVKYFPDLSTSLPKLPKLNVNISVR
jgi:hypothetical protein